MSAEAGEPTETSVEIPRRKFLPLAISLFPLLGVCVELVLGLFDSVFFDPFPRLWHTACALVAGVVFMCYREVCADSGRHLALRVALFGAASGLGLFYALLFFPYFPIIIMSVLALGAGLLAAGPFWSVLLAVDGFRRLRQSWRDAGRSTVAFYVVSLFCLLLFPVAVAVSEYREARVIRDIIAVGRAQEPADELIAIERLREFEPLRILASATGVREGRIQAGRRWVGGRDGGLLPSALIPSVWMGVRDVEPEDVDAALFLVHGLRRSDLLQPEGQRWWWDEEGRDSRFDATEFEDAAGDDVKNGVIDDLEIRRSDIEVVVDTAVAAATVDWTMEIRNTGSSRREARLGFTMPRDAVASDLHLRIAGVERPAAFAAEGRVVEAYVDVAQRRRQDPALLREVGPGRLRLLVFPVLPYNAQDVRITLTAPLEIHDDQSTIVLPTIIDRNMKLPTGFVHRVSTMVDGAVPRIRDVDGVVGPQRIDVPGEPVLDRQVWAEDAHGFCAQTIVEGPAWDWPEHVWIVVEETAETASVDWEVALGRWPAATRCHLFVAGYERKVAKGLSPADAADRLASLRYVGGIDAMPTVEAAVTDAAAAEPSVRENSLILWVHGRMLRDAQPLYVLRRGLDAYGGELVVMPRRPTLNRVAEGLRAAGLARAPSTNVGTIEERIARFAQDGGLPAYERVFERRAEAPIDGVKVGPGLTILEAAQRARRLALQSKDEAAVAIAEDYRLVTAGVGAVVLERKEQYARHKLDPDTVSAAQRGVERGGQGGGQGSPVPEPSTWILVGSALLLLLLRRGFSRP